MREDVFEQRWRRESRLELGNRNVDMISPVTKYNPTWPTDGYVLEIPVRGIQLLDCPISSIQQMVTLSVGWSQAVGR